MNWDALGSIAELVAAITVVGTASYLARQIQQSTLVAKSQVMDSWVSDLNSTFIQAFDRDVADLVRKAQIDFHSLDAVDQMRFNTAFFVPQCLLAQNLFLIALTVMFRVK